MPLKPRDGLDEYERIRVVFGSARERSPFKVSGDSAVEQLPFA